MVVTAALAGPFSCTWCSGKLGPHYAGPFQVVERISSVAYHLLLPEGARIHDVFHISVLKSFHGTAPSVPPPLPLLQNGCLLHEPKWALCAQLRRGEWHVLIKWKGLPEGKLLGSWPLPCASPSLSFSSRTSYFPKEGEMLWWATRIRGAWPSVASC